MVIPQFTDMDIGQIVFPFQDGKISLACLVEDKSISRTALPTAMNVAKLHVHRARSQHIP
jgi:hypothetical protein